MDDLAKTFSRKQTYQLHKQAILGSSWH